MFEFDQSAVDALLVDSAKFRRIYDKHASLKLQISGVNGRKVVMKPADLEGLKKAKLLLKDQMAGMLKDFRPVVPSAS